MTTTLLPTPSSAAAEMVASGQEQLAEIQSRIDDLDARISTIEATLETLAHTRAARVQPLDDARIACQQASETLEQAQAYAALAHKTPNEQQAVKAASTAKKSLQAAQKKLDELVRADADANTAEASQEEELRNKKHLLEAERDTRHAELAAVQRGYSQAHQELGLERYAALIFGFQSHSERVLDAQTHLVAEQIEGHDYHQEALASLADWPDLQKDMAALVPLDDPTVRVIQATLQYLAVLRSDGVNVRMTTPTPWDIRDVLYVREGEMFSPGNVELRQHRLQQVLDAYVAYARAEA